MLGRAGSLFTGLGARTLSSVVRKTRLIHRYTHGFEVVMVKVIASRPLVFPVAGKLLMTFLLFQAFKRAATIFMLCTFGILLSIVRVLRLSQQ